MPFRLSTLVAALTFCSAFAAPAIERREQHLEEIQCRCLTYRASEPPTPCNFFESKGFGWRSAQTIASQYDVKVQFASKSTIFKVLAISAPLPSEVLQATSIGDAQSAPREASSSRNKIVCGFGNEVRKMTQHLEDHRSEGHFIGQVIAWLMLFIVLYAAGEYIWTRCLRRNRFIKLKGEEKPLKAVTPIKSSPSRYAPSFT
ncbi:hypothetical protein SVAN01_01800 [Stagonosporopsis vannaccii]|nr:hypothetical protein SVAN01_01800 [Stagonosporopsis vannaccii]